MEWLSPYNRYNTYSHVHVVQSDVCHWPVRLVTSVGQTLNDHPDCAAEFGGDWWICGYTG